MRLELTVSLRKKYITELLETDLWKDNREILEEMSDERLKHELERQRFLMIEESEWF